MSFNVITFLIWFAIRLNMAISPNIYFFDSVLILY